MVKHGVNHIIGQVAVAAVILNRVNSPVISNTVAGVIFEPRAFTAVADGQIWLEPNQHLKKRLWMRLTDGILLGMLFITLIRIQQQAHGFGHVLKLSKSGNTFSVDKESEGNMIRTILIVLLAIGVVGVGYWEYSEHQ